jgi:hypothetical protein
MFTLPLPRLNKQIIEFLTMSRLAPFIPSVMLSRRPSDFLDLHGRRTGPTGLLTLCVSHLFSKKISSYRSRHRMLLCVARSLLPSSPPRAPSRATRLPHPTPRSIPRCAPPSSRSAPSPAAPPLLRTCHVPHTHRGASAVVAPHQKVVAAVDAMAATMRDLCKEMLR